MSQGLTSSVLRHQYVWGLCAHGQQVVKSFHSAVASASVEQRRRRASDAVSWALQRSTDDMETGLSQRDPGPQLCTHTAPHAAAS